MPHAVRFFSAKLSVWLGHQQTSRTGFPKDTEMTLFLLAVKQKPWSQWNKLLSCGSATPTQQDHAMGQACRGKHPVGRTKPTHFRLSHHCTSQWSQSGHTDWMPTSGQWLDEQKDSTFTFTRRTSAQVLAEHPPGQTTPAQWGCSRFTWKHSRSKPILQTENFTSALKDFPTVASRPLPVAPHKLWHEASVTSLSPFLLCQKGSPADPAPRNTVNSCFYSATIWLSIIALQFSQSLFKEQNKKSNPD